MPPSTPRLAPASSTHAGKYLTVGLGQEAYGISVLKVREIIRQTRITPVPQLPDYVKGVSNLRGRVIAIADLRQRFGLPAETTDRTCTVVVQLALAHERTLLIGLIVDTVEEVITLTDAEIEPTPEFGTRVEADYLLGLAKVKDRLKILLDIDRVIAADTATELARSVA